MITLSSSGRYFLRDEKPFFWLGDTAWELFHRTTLAEARLYLDNRARLGFNVIEAAILAEHDGLHQPNSNGDVPLTNDDPAQPDERYFQYVDALVAEMNARGMIAGLLPAWGDKVNKKWGDGPQVFTAQNAYGYGEFLGARYREYEVVWILGGDRESYTDGIDYAPVWTAMAAGIQATYRAHAVFSYHPQGHRSSSEAFQDAPWLTFNMWQSGHSERDLPVWEWIAQDYARMPIKPIVDGEPCYEDHPIDPWRRAWLPEHGRFDEYDVRKQCYRSIFTGGCGVTYGYHSIWQFASAARPPIAHAAPFWPEARERPGAAQMIHLRQLIEPLLASELIPDQSLMLTPPMDRADYRVALRSQAGDLGLIYCPTGKEPLILNTRRLQRPLAIEWFNPITGEQTVANAQIDQPVATLTLPDTQQDWVCILKASENDIVPR